MASAVHPAFAHTRVSGYYRSSGTYVQPYVRSNPNGLRYDNYGYAGGSRYNASYGTRGSSWNTPSWNTDGLSTDNYHYTFWPSRKYRYYSVS